MGKKILIGVIAILVIIQFFGIDKDVPEFDKSRGFINQTNPPENVSGII